MVVRRPLPTIQHIMCMINIVSKFVADVILVYQQSGSKCLRNGKDGLIRNHPFRYTINYEKAVITIGVNIVQLQKYLITKLSSTILEFKQYQDLITTIGLHQNIENRMTSDVLKLFN